MKRQLLIALAATLPALASSAALANDNADQNSGANNDVYNSMDANGDNKVSEDEFHDYYVDSGIYDTWDADDDGWIDDDEFGDGLYDYYDDDDDGYIDDAEWENGVMVDDYGEYGFWDA